MTSGILESDSDVLAWRSRSRCVGLPWRGEWVRIVVHREAEKEQVGAVQRRNKIRTRNLHARQRIGEDRVIETNDAAFAGMLLGPSDLGVLVQNRLVLPAWASHPVTPVDAEKQIEAASRPISIPEGDSSVRRAFDRSSTILCSLKQMEPRAATAHRHVQHRARI